MVSVCKNPVTPGRSQLREEEGCLGRGRTADAANALFVLPRPDWICTRRLSNVAAVLLRFSFVSVLCTMPSQKEKLPFSIFEFHFSRHNEAACSAHSRGATNGPSTSNDDKSNLNVCVCVCTHARTHARALRRSKHEHLSVLFIQILCHLCIVPHSFIHIHRVEWLTTYFLYSSHSVLLNINERKISLNKLQIYAGFY